MSDNQLSTIVKDQGLEANAAKELMEAFGLPLNEAGEVLAVYKTHAVTNENDTTGMKKAKEMRLVLKKSRTTVENKRKELKADIIKQGRAIDAVATFVKEIIVPAEKYLELQEKFAEIKHNEQMDKRRAQRSEKLSQYVANVNAYNLDEMTDGEFDSLVQASKELREIADAADRKREAERVAAEKAEQERQRAIQLENERLKEEREKQEIEQKKKDAEAAKVLQAERAKAQAAEDARKKLEDEQKARQAEEDLKAAEAAEAERQLLVAPDKQKLLNYADRVSGFIFEGGVSVQSPEAMKLLESFKNATGELVERLRNKAGQL